MPYLSGFKFWHHLTYDTYRLYQVLLYRKPLVHWILYKLPQDVLFCHCKTDVGCHMDYIC